MCVGVCWISVSYSGAGVRVGAELARVEVLECLRGGEGNLRGVRVNRVERGERRDSERRFPGVAPSATVFWYSGCKGTRHNPGGRMQLQPTGCAVDAGQCHLSTRESCNSERARNMHA